MSQVLPQDEGNGFRMPDLPPAGGDAVNYGYTPTAVAMPSSMGMPNLNLQAPEFGIVDPTYLAQLAILNQGAGSFAPSTAPVAPMGLLGAGLESQEQFKANAPLLGGAPMIADWRAYSPNRSANAELNRAIAESGGSYEAQTGRDYYMDPTSYTGGLVQSLVNSGTYAPVVDMTTINGQPSPTYGTVSLGGDMGPSYGGVGGGYEGSINNRMSQADMMAAQEAGFNDSGSSDSGGGKIVCTAMNQAYGFGSFRNRIWLAYAAKNLTKAHEVGYHTMFLPLVNAGYKQGKWFSKPLRAVLENIARHRSADLRAEMRGGKRDRVGQAYRFILEPLCYAVGKLKGY